MIFLREATGKWQTIESWERTTLKGLEKEGSGHREEVDRMVGEQSEENML